MSAKVLPFRPARPESGELTDRSVVAACGLGDTAALGFLFDRYHTVVARYLAHVTSLPDADLDDLVQQTFLAAWQAAARFRGEARVRTWLLGIATNVARHHRRAEVRRRVAFTVLGWQPEPAEVQPDEAAAQRQAADRIERALPSLPIILREVFVLCDIEGLSGGEAARTLGVPEGTIWRRLHDARASLRTALERGRP